MHSEVHAAFFLVWGYAVLIALVHYFGEEIAESIHAHRSVLTSFAAGVTITYVFLQLLPEHHKGLEFLGEFGTLSALFGFTVIHVAEKFIYKYEHEIDDIRRDFKELHSAFLFFYYFAIGIILTQLLNRSLLEGTLFFIPVLFHTTISSLSLIELHDEALDNNVLRFAITLAVLLGVGVAQLVNLNPVLFHSLLGTMTGMFLYIAVHDSLPEEKRGAPLSFLAGTFFYSAVMVVIWTVL